MPTYEYLCDACEHSFDEFQSMSEPPLTKCPECGRKKLRRLPGTGAAILFKGSGFYQTDYRSESYRSAAKAETEATKSTDGTGGTNGSTDTAGKANNSAAKTGKGPASSGGKK
jgi:putative FmdB family regulatory protein